MSKVFSVFTIIITLFIEPNVMASEVRLFSEYVFGDERSRLLQIEGIKDCSETFQKGGLCLENQQFVGHDVNILFSLERDHLNMVIVSRVFTIDFHNSVGRELNADYQLVAIEGKDGVFDVLAEYRVYGPNKYGARLKEFENYSFKNEKITYFYIEKNQFTNLSKRSGSFGDMIKASKAGLKVITYSIHMVDRVPVSNVAYSLFKSQ
ncbi:MAG: hypothetical protein AB2598_10780 [Candidatus Thiodiazotropha sp.]